MLLLWIRATFSTSNAFTFYTHITVLYSPWAGCFIKFGTAFFAHQPVFPPKWMKLKCGLHFDVTHPVKTKVRHDLCQSVKCCSHTLAGCVCLMPRFTAERWWRLASRVSNTKKTKKPVERRYKDICFHWFTKTFPNWLPGTFVPSILAWLINRPSHFGQR